MPLGVTARVFTAVSHYDVHRGSVLCVYSCPAQAHMADVINNEKHFKVLRIEDKPTSALEQLRSERHSEEINKGLLEMSHTWTENSVRI